MAKRPATYLWMIILWGALALLLMAYAVAALHYELVIRSFVGIQLNDALVNFVGFLPLGLLLTGILRSRPRAAIFYSVLIALVVSGGLELAQIFLPARTPSTTDWILNTTGAAVGSILFLLVSSKYKRRSA